MHKQKPKAIISSQDGSALIIVMLVLIALTALGITAINITSTEINLAANDKWQKVGFFNADPGLHGTPAVIYPNLNDDTEAPLPPADPADPSDEGCLEYINYTSDGPSEFYNLVVNTPKQDPEPNDYVSKDISLRACGILADIDVCPRGTVPLSGMGVEFASRLEGLGVSGGQAKLYRITSTGDGADTGNNYTVSGHYRWVDTPGGLK